jgi:hypothetical protein
MTLPGASNEPAAGPPGHSGEAAGSGYGLTAGTGEPAERRPRPARSSWPDAAAMPADEKPPRSGTAVLADRLAAVLVHHEPGWRLPRHSALARRYDTSVTLIDAAISELVKRHLIRRYPDGQLYRASPAEYQISLEGVPGLTPAVDPMGGELTCQSRQTSWRRIPEDISWALHINPGEPACVVRVLWTAGGQPAACATTYLPAVLARQVSGSDAGVPGKADAGAASFDPATVASALSLLPHAAGPHAGEAAERFVIPVGTATSMQLEMQLPPPAVARSLRLSVGEPAAIVTVRFDDPETRKPVGLSVTVVRPDLFRIVVQSPAAPLPDGGEGNFTRTWTHAVDD